MSHRMAGFDRPRDAAVPCARAWIRGTVAGLLLGCAVSAPVHAQNAACMAILCAPSVVVEPAVNRSHLFGGPAVRSLINGSESRLPSQSNLELLFVVAAPTRIPLTSVFASLQWLPNASARANPFTEYTASELGSPAVRANMPSVSVGASVDAVSAAITHGWGTVAPYVADLFSNAARPDDRSAYTHKLDVGVNLGVGILNWLSPNAWLRNVKGFVILDDVLTGLPHAGDDVPQGERVFLTAARPATLIAGVSIPVAPLKPHS